MRPTVEERILLDKFKPRPYQQALIDAFKKYKKMLCIWPRRGGKDLCCWNIMIEAALDLKGIYYYIYPTYNQGRRALFAGQTNDGLSFVEDYIPKSLVTSINTSEMKITLVNGSTISICGSQEYNRLLGTNPRGIVMSEYATSNPEALRYLRPILMGNNGWLVVNSTPRGHDSLWDLYNIATTSDDWFCSHLTIEDTQHISIAEIQKGIDSGEYSDEFAKQEFWSSFSHGVLGSFYANQLNNMRLQERLGYVPYESNYPVHTSWDIGLDTTAIIMFQVIGACIHIISYYENSNLSLDHYISIVKNQPYTVWGKHIAPHDMANREFTSGISRLDTARELGLSFTLAPNISINDGIEAVKAMLSKCWIDETKCKRLIKCIDNYRQVFDEKTQRYSGKPLHDQFSHGCDALRMMALSLSKLRKGTSPEELTQRYNEAVLGDDAKFPRFFQSDEQQY